MAYHLDADPYLKELAKPGEPTCGLERATHNGYGRRFTMYCARPLSHDDTFHASLVQASHPADPGPHVQIWREVREDEKPQRESRSDDGEAGMRLLMEAAQLGAPEEYRYR